MNVENIGEQFMLIWSVVDKNVISAFISFVDKVLSAFFLENGRNEISKRFETIYNKTGKQK